MRISILFLFILFWMSCTNNDVAGGVSEETNTVAGVLFDKSYKPIGNALVQAKLLFKDSVFATDTTDSNGHFYLALKKWGTYGISAQKDSLAFFETMEFKGRDTTIRGSLISTSKFSGKILPKENLNLSGIKVCISGSMWCSLTDSLGVFNLNSIPQKDLSLWIYSPDLTQFSNVNYFLKFDKEFKIYGPIVDSLSVHPDSLEILYSIDYGLYSIWQTSFISENGHYNFIPDIRNFADDIILYGTSRIESDKQYGQVVHFKSEKDFGVIENDRGLFNQVHSFAIDLVFRIDSILEDSSSYRRNILGKLGYGDSLDRDVFSVAIVQGDCGVTNPSLAFFVQNGSDNYLSCDYSIIMPESVELKKWINLTAVWDGSSISLYKNGEIKITKKIDLGFIENSDEPIYVGKALLDFMISKIRISIAPLTKSDVFFRFHQFQR